MWEALWAAVLSVLVSWAAFVGANARDANYLLHHPPPDQHLYFCPPLIDRAPGVDLPVPPCDW